MPSRCSPMCSDLMQWRITFSRGWNPLKHPKGARDERVPWLRVSYGGAEFPLVFRARMALGASQVFASLGEAEREHLRYAFVFNLRFYQRRLHASCQQPRIKWLNRHKNALATFDPPIMRTSKSLSLPLRLWLIFFIRILVLHACCCSS